MSIFHSRKYIRKCTSNPGQQHVHVCNFNIDSKNVCGQNFSSVYQLRKHREHQGHCKKRKKKIDMPVRKFSKICAARMLVLEVRSGEGRVDQGEFEDKENGRESVDESYDQAQSEIEKECELIVESECEVQGEEIVQQEDKCDELDKGYEVCMVCMLPEENDEEGEIWVECTQYFIWIHVKCIPADCIVDFTDDDFACPTCFRGKREKK